MQHCPAGRIPGSNTDQDAAGGRAARAKGARARAGPDKVDKVVKAAKVGAAPTQPLKIQLS